MGLPRFVDNCELLGAERIAKQKDGNCKATAGPGTKTTGSAALGIGFFKINFRIAKLRLLPIPNQLMGRIITSPGPFVAMRKNSTVPFVHHRCI
jgi:hypothetical protein